LVVVLLAAGLFVSGRAVASGTVELLVSFAPGIGSSAAEFVVAGVLFSDSRWPHPASVITAKDNMAGNIIFAFMIFLGLCFVRCLISISTGKLGANRTLMLGFMAGTPGLPFECAQLIFINWVVIAAFIYCFQLLHLWC